MRKFEAVGEPIKWMVLAVGVVAVTLLVWAW